MSNTLCDLRKQYLSTECLWITFADELRIFADRRSEALYLY